MAVEKNANVGVCRNVDFHRNNVVFASDLLAFVRADLSPAWGSVGQWTAFGGVWLQLDLNRMLLATLSKSRSNRFDHFVHAWIFTRLRIVDECALTGAR